MSKKRTILAIVAVIALVAILGVCLVACNAKSYEKKLKKAGYEVEVYSDSELKLLNEEMKLMGYGEVKFCVEAGKYDEKTDSGEEVTIIKFKKSADAKKYYNDMKDEMKDVEGVDIYKTGSIIISGTKQGVKDAK